MSRHLHLTVGAIHELPLPRRSSHYEPDFGVFRTTEIGLSESKLRLAFTQPNFYYENF